MNDKKQLALELINARKCITARTLMAELMAHDISWQKEDVKKAIIELSLDDEVVEIELIYADGTNESIFLPKETSIRISKMSLTRNEWIEMWNRIKRIEYINKKIWNRKHYKWANDINWELQRMKDKIQSVIGQME